MNSLKNAMTIEVGSHRQFVDYIFTFDPYVSVSQFELIQQLLSSVLGSLENDRVHSSCFGSPGLEPSTRHTFR
jgi:hypothetical protein